MLALILYYVKCSPPHSLSTWHRGDKTIKRKKLKKKKKKQKKKTSRFLSRIETVPDETCWIQSQMVYCEEALWPMHKGTVGWGVKHKRQTERINRRKNKIK